MGVFFQFDSPIIGHAKLWIILVKPLGSIVNIFSDISKFFIIDYRTLVYDIPHMLSLNVIWLF